MTHKDAEKTSYDEFMVSLQQRLPDLTPSHRKIALRLLESPDEAAFMSISDLAQSVDVDISTVSRFTRDVGLSGYAELRRQLRQRLVDQARLVRRLERFQQQDGNLNVIDSMSSIDADNVLRTFAKLDRDSFHKASSRLAESSSVFVVGYRKCFSIAHYTTYALRLIRNDVFQLTNTDGTMVDQIRTIGPSDCLVSISIHRYTDATVSAYEHAKSNRACTISLTDNPTSPIARGADFAFFVDTSSEFVLRSITAFLSLAQAFAAQVARNTGSMGRDALMTQEELLDNFDIYNRSRDR